MGENLSIQSISVPGTRQSMGAHDQTLRFSWPPEIYKQLGKDIFHGTHNGPALTIFSDAALADLLDRYPREKLGIYRFPSHDRASGKAEHGSAQGLSGAEILQAVKDGQIWLNLRAVNAELPEYRNISKSIFSALGAAAGMNTLKEDVGVLISSPGIHVHYHLDIPLVCLVQIRGQKTLHLYPEKAPFVKSRELSAFALRKKDEQMTYSDDFDSAATSVVLNPGMAITWPQTAPHRVQNSDCLNVSLSCEFMTTPAILKANAMHTNAVIGNMTGWHSGFPKSTGPVTVAKAVAARALKKISPPPAKAPVPVSFELQKDGTVRSLRNPASQEFKEFTCTKVRPHDLSARDLAAWRELCQSHFQYQSPLLMPDFARLVAEVRRDVMCLLVHKDDKLVAALAAHVRPGGLLRPVGEPFSDYAGPVIAPETGFTAEQVIKMSGFAAYRPSHLILTPDQIAHVEPDQLDAGYVINLDGQTAEEFCEAKRSEHAKRHKNFRRLRNKLEREAGPVEFFHEPATRKVTDQLFAWKREQFQTDGLLDITSSPLSAQLLHKVRDTPPSEEWDCYGYQTGLRVGETLIVGHFGVRQGGSFHPWISSYDPDYAAYSPGQLLLMEVIAGLDDMGLQTYDLSEGHDFYKKYFGDPARFSREAHMSSTSLLGRMQSLGYHGWKVLGTSHPGTPASRMRRRFDHIAACEPRMTGRLKEVVYSVLKRSSKSSAVPSMSSEG